MWSLAAINQHLPTARVMMYDRVLIATCTVKYCEEANKFAHYNSLAHTVIQTHMSNKYTGLLFVLVIFRSRFKYE